MDMSELWNVGLTAALGFVVWWAKTQHEELRRVQILLNRTREDIAKEYVTKSDSSEDMSQIMSKFDRIEEKIDRLMDR